MLHGSCGSWLHFEWCGVVQDIKISMVWNKTGCQSLLYIHARCKVSTFMLQRFCKLPKTVCVKHQCVNPVQSIKNDNLMLTEKIMHESAHIHFEKCWLQLQLNLLQNQDFRPLPHEAIQRERFPIRIVEEMLIEMNGSKVFSKLDLNMGFHQIELDEASRLIPTFTTHAGLFRYKRLMFGVSSAPEIYQYTIQQVLKDCPGS